MSVGGTGPTKAAAKKNAADGNDGRGDELPPAAIIRERDDEHGTGYEYSPGGGVELRKNRVALMSLPTQDTVALVDDAVPLGSSVDGGGSSNDGGPSKGARRAQGRCCHGYRMDFASALLFVLGSVFYVELACVGYLYARDMRYVPTYVLTADDDATWISYKLEERYNASSVSSSTGGTAVEKEPVRALATDGDDSAVAEGDDTVVAGDDTVVAGDDAVGSALVAEGDDSVGYDDSFVSYDDDYVFQVGSSEVWVSQYQIIYFVAAFCFATAGLLDLIADRRLYHLFRFFGGVFGVASACTIETQALASSITSAVSVHLFLMDAIAMLWIYKFGGTSLVVGKLMNVILAVGALSYLWGTMIDVVISYLWIFDDTIDWNMKTAMAEIIAAALWLTCSLCYMGYFFYDFCGAHNTNARLEESEDDESVPRKPGKVDLDSLERTEGNIH